MFILPGVMTISTLGTASGDILPNTPTETSDHSPPICNKPAANQTVDKHGAAFAFYFGKSALK